MALMAEQIPIEVIRSVRGLVPRIRKHDGDLARQLCRAVNSVALNASEGERRAGRDALHLFRIAAGSAKEAQRCLLGAQAWGYVTEEECGEALRLLDRELGLLWGLTHPK